MFKFAGKPALLNTARQFLSDTAKKAIKPGFAETAVLDYKKMRPIIKENPVPLNYDVLKKEYLAKNSATKEADVSPLLMQMAIGGGLGGLAGRLVANPEDARKGMLYGAGAGALAGGLEKVIANKLIHGKMLPNSEEAKNMSNYFMHYGKSPESMLNKDEITAGKKRILDLIKGIKKNKIKMTPEHQEEVQSFMKKKKFTEAIPEELRDSIGTKAKLSAGVGLYPSSIIAGGAAGMYPNKIDDAFNQGQKAAEEKIKGGLGDNVPDSEVPKTTLERGMKVEKEHTPDPDKQKEIVKDHHAEFPFKKRPDYYDYLADAEDKMKEELKKVAYLVGYKTASLL